MNAQTKDQSTNASISAQPLPKAFRKGCVAWFRKSLGGVTDAQRINELKRGLLARFAQRCAGSLKLASPLFSLRSGLPDQSLADLDALLDALDPKLSNFLALASFLTALSPASRKQLGAHYTPLAIAERVAHETLAGWRGMAQAPRLADPAVGAGAFLIATLDALAERGMSTRAELAAEAWGVDLNPIAVDACQASLELWAGEALDGLSERVICANALLDAPLERASFDLIVGNPPWVSFSGRHAAQTSASALKKLRANYRSIREGWPATHSAFLEYAASLLNPTGRLGMLVPRQVCDLDQYAALREELTRDLKLDLPCISFGERAFENVTEPCVAICASKRDAQAESVALPLPTRDAAHSPDTAVIPLNAPGRMQNALNAFPSLRSTDKLLVELNKLERFPAESFGDIGLHSGNAAKLLFTASPKAPDAGWRPVLQGRDVNAGKLQAPSLWLNPDPPLEAKHYWRKASDQAYQRCRILLRQTAKQPVAAPHQRGYIFRNSALACFGLDWISDHALLALFNSELFAWIHRTRFADARQRAFPQVKVKHLRELPLPAQDGDEAAELLSAIDSRAHADLNDSALSPLIFDLYRIPSGARPDIEACAAA